MYLSLLEIISEIFRFFFFGRFHPSVTTKRIRDNHWCEPTRRRATDRSRRDRVRRNNNQSCQLDLHRMRTAMKPKQTAHFPDCGDDDSFAKISSDLSDHFAAQLSVAECRREGSMDHSARAVYQCAHESVAKLAFASLESARQRSVEPKFIIPPPSELTSIVALHEKVAKTAFKSLESGQSSRLAPSSQPKAYSRECSSQDCSSVDPKLRRRLPVLCCSPGKLPTALQQVQDRKTVPDMSFPLSRNISSRTRAPRASYFSLLDESIPFSKCGSDPDERLSQTNEISINPSIWNSEPADLPYDACLAALKMNCEISYDGENVSCERFRPHKSLNRLTQ